MTTKYAGAVRVAALALVWGSGFLWIKIGLRSFTPIEVTTLRMALGAATLLLILRVKALPLPRTARLWGHLTVAALLGNAVPYLLFSIAEQDVSSSTAGIVNASTPLWAVWFTFLAYRDRGYVRRNALSLALGVAGTVLIFRPWDIGTEILSPAGLACLAAAVSYGASYVYIGHFLAGTGSNPLPMAAGQLVCATVLTVVAVPFFGLTAPAVRADGFAAVAVLGVVGTGLAYLLNYRIIADDGPIAASVVVFLLPVVATVLGVAVLGESIHLLTIVGMAVILVGVRYRRNRMP